MRQKDQLKLTGRAYLRVIDPKTGKTVKVIPARNLVCNEGKQLVGGFLIDESDVYDVGITYMEIGTGSTTPTVDDTTLTTYAAREAVTSRSRTANEITISTFWTAAQCTYNIKEAGVWGGSGAAAGEATGLLFAHWLTSYDNSAGNYDLAFDYVLAIG